MDQKTAPDSAIWSLRSRGPAYAVSRTCLEAQAAARPRNLPARLGGMSPLHPDAEIWYQRALAERQVAGLLSELGPEYRVLHSIPDTHRAARGKTPHTSHPQCAGEHIDHLVIGPPGVFTISTECHPHERVEVSGSELLADGHRMPDLHTAEHEALLAKKALSRATGLAVTVTPVVVVVGARTLRRRSERPTPVVLDVKELSSWARTRLMALGPDVVASIARAAEEWTTWRPLTAELGVPTDPSPAFDRLHREVVVAARIRRLWLVGAAAAIVILAFGAAFRVFA